MWVFWLLDRSGIIEGYSRVRKLLNFLPHLPTLFLSAIFWWFYQVYTCGYLAFVEESGWKQSILSVIVCGGIGMTAASVYGTTLQRYPLRPKKFMVSPDFEQLNPADRTKVFERVIAETGANTHHITKACGTCRIVRPERAHHCAICDVCTPRMDHHCVALHKCIHYKNQKQFALFFFWMCFSVAVAVISFHPYVMRANKEGKSNNGVSFIPLNQAIISYTVFYSRYLGFKYNMANMGIVCLVLSSLLAYFLFAIFSVVFANFMWFCVIRSGTIVACNKSTRFGGTFPGIYTVESRTRCFRKPTILENIQVIFGKSYKLWAIPIANEDTDGWLHSCTCTSNPNL